jgi:imidazolonepropionase-like amidohydrolase
LPGLIDVHVHIGSQGGIPENPAAYNPRKVADRALASYLFSGVTAIKSAGDFLNNVLEARSRIQSEEKLGAELFATGPLFTTDGGHGTEFFKDSPEFLQKMASDQFTRTPKSAAEARMQVAQLKQRGVDGIKAVLDGGVSGMLFNRMDPAILKAIAEAAKAANLPLVVHTGDARDVADAIAAGANGIEHGSMRDRIPDETFADMARRGVYYDPTLSVAEAFNQFVQGKSDLLDRTLVAQTAPPKLIQNTRKMLTSPQMQKQRERMKAYPADMDIAGDNLVRAAKAGVRIVTGSDAGNMLVLHGPTIHRELQLWVKAGVPAKEALQGATSSAAGLLGSDKRFGFIRQGYDASMILVDGNPLKDISITERISAVFYKGEWVVRSELFDDEK